MSWTILYNCKPIQEDFPILEQEKTKGCQLDGKFYKAGSIVQSDKCFDLRCSSTGKIFRKMRNCDKTPTPITVPMTTTPQTTGSSTPFGCQGDDGKIYGPGEMISEGFDENWCYGKYCSDDGNVINWDDFNCKTTTPLPTTVSSTTSPPTTVSSTTSPPTTVSSTTPPPTTVSSTPFGCQGDDGKMYGPGEKISEGFDETSNWCYGTYCSDDGNLINWDNFNCKTTPATTVPLINVPMTTKPPTIFPMTTSP